MIIMKDMIINQSIIVLKQMLTIQQNKCLKMIRLTIL